MTKLAQKRFWALYVTVALIFVLTAVLLIIIPLCGLPMERFEIKMGEHKIPVIWNYILWFGISIAFIIFISVIAHLRMALKLTKER